MVVMGLFAGVLINCWNNLIGDEKHLLSPIMTGIIGGVTAYLKVIRCSPWHDLKLPTSFKAGLTIQKSTGEPAPSKDVMVKGSTP